MQAQWLSWIVPSLCGGLFVVGTGLIAMYKRQGEHEIQIRELAKEAGQHRADSRESIEREKHRNDAQDVLISKQAECLARIDQNVVNLVSGIERIERQMSR